VLVEIAGCGVCHTDVGFLYDSVPTKHALPLVLGHEISGVVVATSASTRAWEGRRVIVPRSRLRRVRLLQGGTSPPAAAR